MPRKTLAFLEANRITTGVLVFCLLASVGVYRWVAYPFSVQEAVAAETAIAFTTESPKSRKTALDSATYPRIFHYFPGLKQDYSLFSQLLHRESQAVWSLDHLGGKRYALSCAAAGYQEFFLDSLTRTGTGSTSVYQGIQVHQLVWEEQRIAYARYRNLLLLGRLPLQVEGQIAQLQSKAESWLEDRELQPKQCWINPANFPAFVSGFLGGAALAKSRDWAEALPPFALRWPSQEDTISLRGRLAAYPLPEAEDTAAYRVLSYLPASIAWCSWRSLALPETSNPLFAEYIAPWLGKGIAQLQMPLPGGIEQNRVVLLRAKNTADAEEALEALGRESGQLQSYNFQLFTIRQLFSGEALAPLRIDMPTPYAVVLGEYVAFSTGRTALEQVANAYLLGQSIQTLPEFRRLWPELRASRMNAWFFFNGKRGRNRVKEWLVGHRDEWSALLRDYPFWMGSLRSGGVLQVKAAAGIGQQGEDSQAGLLWSAPIGTEVANCPQPYPAGGWLIEDKKHRLYLLKDNGEQRWRFQLPKPLLNAPQFVRQGEQRPPDIAFATPHRLYLLHPDGQPLPPYPVEWPSPARSPLLITPLEGQRFFGSFVSTDEGVYGLKHDGRPLPAWSPNTRADTLVRHPVRHFQQAGKDYFILLSENGTLYALQRDGSPRFDALKLSGTFQSPPYFQADEHHKRIAIGSREGFAHIINLQGQHFRLQLLPGAQRARFLFAQIVGDGRKDYLAWDEERLALHYYDGGDFLKHFEYQFPAPPSEVFLAHKDGQPCIGWWSRAKQRIYLLNSDGELMPGFPLAGSTPFKTQPLPDGGTMVVCGYGDQVYAYRVE